MPARDQELFRRPGWNQAGLWMGADLSALLRILCANGWRVHPAYWFDCAVDLAFAAGNTLLRCVQWSLYSRRIAAQTLSQSPLFIIGHWRTGTTLLHELLALDPRHSVPTTYCCFVPNHFLLSERFVTSWSGFALPSNRPPDAMRMGWDLPQEDEFALCNSGVPSLYATIAFPNHPPQNLNYLELEAVTPRQRERWKRALLRFLQRLQLRKPGRIVLKSPQHTFRIPLLLEMFPDAKFVYLARHPQTVVLSTIRLWKSLFSTHGYQKPNFCGLDEFVLSLFERMDRRYQNTKHLIPDGRLVEVRYEDLVAGIPAEVNRIYHQLDLGDFDTVREAVDDYVSQHAGYQPNRHRPDPELQQQVRERCSSYFQRYGYAD